MSKEVKLFEFNWSVESAGYEWRYNLDKDCQKTYCLLPRRIFGQFEIDKTTNQLIDIDSDIKSYDPYIEYPVLYRKFAELPKNKDDFLDFANKYGMLGIGKPLQLSNNLVPDKNDFCEALDQWEEEIENLGLLLKFWDNLKSKNTEFFNKRIFWNEESIYFVDASDDWLEAEESSRKYWNEVTRTQNKDGLIFRDLDEFAKRKRFISYPHDEHPFRYHVTDKQDNPGLFEDWKNRHSFGFLERDYKFYIEPAILLFEKLFNKQLNKHQIKQSIKSNEKKGHVFEFDMELTPCSLLGAMYIQFCDEITGKKKIIKCKYCKKPLDITDQKTGRKREFCPNCRQKKYEEKIRNRQKALDQERR